MKAVSYIRVSTDKQDSSLEVQQQAINRYCDYKAIEVTQVITDSDVSAGIPLRDRVGGSELFKGDIATIVIYRLDRAFRNVIDALSSADYFNGNNITLHIVDLAGANINTATATGRLMFTMLAGMAEYERQIIKERTKDGLRKRRENNVRWSGNIPFGYHCTDGKGINHRTGKSNQDVVICKEEQEIIRVVKDRIKRGESYSEIIRAVPNPRGGSLSKSLINKIKHENI